MDRVSQSSRIAQRPTEIQSFIISTEIPQISVYKANSSTHIKILEDRSPVTFYTPPSQRRNSKSLSKILETDSFNSFDVRSKHSTNKSLYLNSPSSCKSTANVESFTSYASRCCTNQNSFVSEDCSDFQNWPSTNKLNKVKAIKTKTLRLSKSIEPNLKAITPQKVIRSVTEMPHFEAEKTVKKSISTESFSVHTEKTTATKNLFALFNQTSNPAFKAKKPLLASHPKSDSLQTAKKYRIKFRHSQPVSTSEKLPVGRPIEHQRTLWRGKFGVFEN